MNFLRKIFDWLFGKKKEKIVTSPPPKEDLALIRISMKKYPKANLLRDTYHIYMDIKERRIYINPKTTSKVLLGAIEETNDLIQNRTFDLDTIQGIETVQERLYGTLYSKFQTGIFKDKDAQIQCYPIEEEQLL
jgi:hypothetical protein